MSPRHPDCGLFIILETNVPQLRAPLTSIDVTAATCGPIAQNVIKFRYRNTNDAAIKSKFIFPANSRTCIYHLSANVGGREIVGKVMEKREAERKYEDAVSSGKSAVLVKQAEEASDIIELELGAFGANEEAEVTIKEIFEVKLTRKGTRFQYKFPTSLFVRYGDTITATASQNMPHTDYVLNFKLTSHHGVDRIIPKPWLGVETAGQLFSFHGNRKVFEKDHDVILDLILSTEYKGFRLTEDGQDNAPGKSDKAKSDTDELQSDSKSETNKTFTSKLKTLFSKGKSTGGSTEKDGLDTKKNTVSKIMKKVVLSSFLVHVPTTPISELPAKEYVFVVDCSGSMSGNRIEHARKTLQQLINSLPVGSYFNIVRFGSTYETLFRTSKEYNVENKQLAVRLAETLGADLGGTELFNCLKSVVECERQIVEFKRQVFVLTDGDIGNQYETFKLVEDNASKNRLFSFGIGSGCSTALVNGLADAGMGHASFITDSTPGHHQEDDHEGLATICIKSLMASASQHISDIIITPKPMAPKEPIKMVVDSTCLNVFHDVLCDVTFKLTLVNNEEKSNVSKQSTNTFETRKSPFEPNVLRKLATTKIIGEMGNDERGIIELSVAEQVLSPYTALVGIADEKTVTGCSLRVDTAIDDDYGLMRNSIVNCSATNFTSSARKCKKSAGFGFRMPRLSFSPFTSTEDDYCGSMRRRSLKSSWSPSPERRSLPRRDHVMKGCTIDDDEYTMDLNCVESIDNYESCAIDDDESCANNDDESWAIDDESECTIYQSITNIQNPGGEWTKKIRSKHDEIFKNIKLSIVDDKTAQFTLYAVLFLLIEFADSFEEWKMSAVKGVTVLKKSISNLDAEITKLLSESKLQVDNEMLAELLS